LTDIIAEPSYKLTGISSMTVGIDGPQILEEKSQGLVIG
jgi:hypothetical protein